MPHAAAPAQLKFTGPATPGLVGLEKPSALMENTRATASKT
jgi:hypothetical protein